MATISYSQLFPSVVAPTVEADLFVVPANPTSGILINGAIKVVNTTGAAITYSIWELPSAGSGALSNNALTDHSIPANDYIIVPLDMLNASQVVRHVAATSGLTIHFHRGYIQAA